MKGTKKFKENETQRNKLSETLRVATTKGYATRKWKGIVRMQGEIEMESFISILCYCCSILNRNAFEDMCTCNRKWEDK